MWNTLTKRIIKSVWFIRPRCEVVQSNRPTTYNSAANYNVNMRDLNCIQAFWRYHSLFQIDFGEMKSSNCGCWSADIHLEWRFFWISFLQHSWLVPDFLCIYLFLWKYRESFSKDGSQKRKENLLIHNYNLNLWFQSSIWVFNFKFQISNFKFQFHF